ncbi:hypothetical protein [Natranaerofaba carboxydovora]|uniref:hypothetical protein n=1 Tax=Natranaerofaba carboxydovora TaxID=2742683 RepID=UPI001F143DCB|nr:hypothetical protein [Natranaerofaba carboxydovora]UMZ74978.1 hypothetical protein ACONDI_02584 [Natranaerofaba carboxydovora]
MELILDGNTYTEGISENNIAEKIKEYITEMNQEGRLVKHIYLDGENNPDIIKDPDSIHDSIADGGVETVEVVSVTQEDLVNETLDTILNYLDKLISYTREIAHSIQTGTIPDKDSIIQLTDSLEWVYQASNGLMITLQDAELKGLVDDLQDVFGQIVNSLKKEDYTSLGDILEYELIEKLEALKNQFDKILSERRG